MGFMAHLVLSTLQAIDPQRPGQPSQGRGAMSSRLAHLPTTDVQRTARPAKIIIRIYVKLSQDGPYPSEAEIAALVL